MARPLLLTIPFLLLLFWFRFEGFLHNHVIIQLSWILLSASALFLLRSLFQKKSRTVALGLWICITLLCSIDFLQVVFLRDYSEKRFFEKIDQCNADVKERIEKQLEMLREDARELQGELLRAPLNPETTFIQLQDALNDADYVWGVYDENGNLLAWNGQVPYRETYVEPGAEDVSVAHLLHQQFLKYKCSVVSHEATFYLTVMRPVAADYGIENRYLHSYNLLTNGLAIHPDLLYNSQSTTSSPDLVIRSIRVTPDFFVSTLYKKQQYNEFLRSRVFQLHWWLEGVTLAFCLFIAIVLFFEFLGSSGRKTTPKRELVVSWVVLLSISLISVLMLMEFSALGSESFFKPHNGPAGGWNTLFQSGGGVLLVSFFLLNVMFTFVLLAWKADWVMRWRSGGLYYGMLFLSVMFFGALFICYHNFAGKALIHGPSDPIDVVLPDAGVLKISQIFGVLWLDLAFVLFGATQLALVMRHLKRNRRNFFALVTLQGVPLLLFHLLYPSALSFPLLPSLVLYYGISLIVFFLPHMWSGFERMNLLSRFIIVLLVLSGISFLFHFTRFHYAGDLQRSFIEKEAAVQVRSQENWIRQVLQTSQQQLDRSIQRVSLDPKIADLAYRLWTRTDLAQLGYKSAIEIYDNEGQVQNRFAVNLPRLAIPVVQVAAGNGWGNDLKLVTLGNTRKPVHIAARRLPQGGFLALQAVQDYENLAFIASSSPFQQVFRGGHESGPNGIEPFLNVYDSSWRPVYVSSPDLSLPTQRARTLLQKSSAAWTQESWSGRNYDVYYFRINNGYAALLVSAISVRSHIVHLIDLLIFNLLWFSLFTGVLLIFYRPYLMLHFPSRSATEFNFFQKLLLAFVIFSMIPMLLLSVFIRNYVWEKKIDQVTLQALNSFSVATKVVGDYLFYRADEQNERSQLFTNELLEWISQVVQRDVSFYYDRYLLAASNREFYSAGLLGEQIQGKAYVDLFLRGQKYSISDAKIGSFRFLNVSGRIYTGRYRDEVITIPFLIDERSVEAEITGLREYMMLVAAGLILFAVFLGYFLTVRFTRPVQVLIQGTSEMSRGNLQYRIRESYRDEFQRLVSSFNAMAASIDEQQEALERRRAYIENILNNITTAVISIDRNTNVTTINPAAAQMFRLDPECRDCVEDMISSSDDWTSVQDALSAFLSERERFQVKEITQFRTNQEIHLRLVYVPLFENKEWNGAVLLIEDISDIIRSNRLSAWAEMARRVAHEVKNPLTPIQLAMEHLVKVYEDRSENFSTVLQSCSEAVLKQVKTLRKLVSEFSQYGRPTVLNRTDVPLKGFLEELVANYKQHLPQGIAMDVEFQADVPHIRIDAEKIRAALMNIIENGLQAMNGTGKITVSAEKDSDHFVKIQIRDNGQGIPPDILPRLFEPYFSTKTGGTGLGLAIARRNIEDHGGKIRVESQPGSGTTVEVLLPA